MDDRLSHVESAVGELERALQAIDRRIAALERQVAAGAQRSPVLEPPRTATAAPPAETSARPPVPSGHDIVTVLSLVGRTFVALGGAYLLRALTDSAILLPRTGIATGLAYAAFWLIMADRAGTAGRRLSATFHGLVTTMIGFPLLWEAITRFKLFGPEAGAFAMTLMTGLALAVAVRHRLQSLAWIAVIPAMTTAVASVTATTFVLPFAVFLILLGVGTLWLGYAPINWFLLRWPVALVADITVLAFVARASSRSWSDPPVPVIAVQLSLLTGYLASIAIRTLIRGRDVIPFEVVQTMAALAVGFGGAVYVAHITGAGEAALQLVNLAFGAGCYGIAFVFIERRQGLRRNFYFYTSLALVLVFVSTNLLLEGVRLALLWTTLGVLSSWVALRVGRVALNLHGAVYIIAAAAASGLLSSATYALLAPASEAWRAFPPVSLLVLAAALVCWLIPMSPAAESWGSYSRLPRLFITVALAWSIGGWIVSLLTRPLAGIPGGGADAGAIATIRTSILAAAALVLAWAGRHDRFRESGWLLYPLLVAGGLKLVIEDLPYSKPATLFIALALYGGALIAAPRMSHQRPARR